MSLADVRNTYALAGLDEAAMADDPLRQFALWLDEATAVELPEPNAMTLATATPDGQPSARMVLLRGLDASGFYFFTDYRSRKGRELSANPRAALVFFWSELHRQVRVEGRVERATPEQSDAYFHSRARGSQLSACASAQSEVIPQRSVLEERVAELARQYPDVVPRPAYWGGFRVVPSVIEFWKGRPNRLHDRFVYTRTADGGWRRQRLSP